MNNVDFYVGSDHLPVISEKNCQSRTISSYFNIVSGGGGGGGEKFCDNAVGVPTILARIVDEKLRLTNSISYDLSKKYISKTYMKYELMTT